MPISPIDRDRVHYINSVMDEIHNEANELYEALVDREYNQVESVTKQLIKKLQDVSESVKDEL